MPSIELRLSGFEAQILHLCYYTSLTNTIVNPKSISILVYSFKFHRTVRKKILPSHRQLPTHFVEMTAAFCIIDSIEKRWKKPRNHSRIIFLSLFLSSFLGRSTVKPWPCPRWCSTRRSTTTRRRSRAGPRTQRSSTAPSMTTKFSACTVRRFLSSIF